MWWNSVENKDNNSRNEGLINLLKYANIKVDSIEKAKKLFLMREEDIKKRILDRIKTEGKNVLKNLIISTNDPECIKSFLEDTRFRLAWSGCYLFN